MTEAGDSRTVRRLWAAMIGLVALGLAVGLLGVSSVQTRAGLVQEVSVRDGPLVVAAQDLYRSLSDADATAASAFLTDGAEPPELRQRYQADIADASAALARLASGAHSGPAADAVAVVAIQLPVYTGLVETARGYHRQGLPVGAAYLREASGVMREQLLPAAGTLFHELSQRLDQTRDRAAGFPVAPVGLGLLALLALGVVQTGLARHTRRTFNPGLVVASLATVAAVLWLTVSWTSVDNHLDTSHRDGSAVVAALSDARIAALQARSDEAHTLVARGAGGSYEESYQESMAALIGSDPDGNPDTILAQAKAQAQDPRAVTAIDTAIAAAEQWQAIHADIRERDGAGDYDAAVALAIGPDQPGAQDAFGRLDQALADGISHSSVRFAQGAERAGDALGGLSLGLASLTVVFLLAAAFGLQRRLAEYR